MNCSRRSWAAWSEKTAITNGWAVCYCAGWAACGLLSVAFHWHRLWEVAPLVITVTAIAAFAHQVARRQR